MASDDDRYGIGDPGVPAAEGESWEETAERLNTPEPGHCPGCETEGNGDNNLAPNQRWCPDQDCPVVSFWEVNDAE